MPKPDPADTSPIVEWRHYTVPAENLPALLDRFAQVSRTVFARCGMQELGYWIDDAGPRTADRTLIYLLGHPSREQARAAWDAFRRDAEWIAARDQSETQGKLVSAYRSIFAKPAPFSEALEHPDRSGASFSWIRCTAERHEFQGKLAALRNRLLPQMQEHGIALASAWLPVDQDNGASQTLLTLFQHASTRDVNEDWIRLREDLLECGDAPLAFAELLNQASHATRFRALRFPHSLNMGRLT